MSRSSVTFCGQLAGETALKCVRDFSIKEKLSNKTATESSNIINLVVVYQLIVCKLTTLSSISHAKFQGNLFSVSKW